jgi:hypothetical protein
MPTTEFTNRLLDGLEKRKDTLNSKTQNVQIAIMTIMLFLAIALLSIHVPVSILGLSSEARNLREILLVAAASIQLMNMLTLSDYANVVELMQVYVSKLAGDNEVAARALRIRYGLGSGVRKFPSTIGARQFPVLVLGAIGLIGSALMAIVISLSIQFVAMWDIIKDPTISSRVSFWVVVYVLMVDVAIFGITIMNSTGFASAEQPLTNRETKDKEEEVVV